METLLLAVEAAIEAGRAVLAVYATDFAIDHKADDSPLTLADRRSHQIIVDRLRAAPFPLLSEEGRHRPYGERKDWRTFWLVDPLDGTKEFVKRNGEFTVNIALIRDGRPVLGVIYVPVGDVLYFGRQDLGAFRLTAAADRIPAPAHDADRSAERLQALCAGSQRLPAPVSTPRRVTVVGSRSHSSPEVQQIVDALRKEHGEVALISAGSSLKICMVAEGSAHLYPRTGPTMEWDTAAGQAIAEAAGARLVVFDTRQPLRYNKENLRNPWFLVESGAMDPLV